MIVCIKKLRSINTKDFGKPGVGCIVHELGLRWCDTSDMAARKSLYLSLQSRSVECVIPLGKDLTTQSAHPVLALVVATDTAECHDFGFWMTAGLSWKGELLLMVRHGCRAICLSRHYFFEWLCTTDTLSKDCCLWWPRVSLMLKGVLWMTSMG